MAERVILFSLDGVRPDGLSEARTPNIDGLIARGSYTPRALSVMPSVTLPCHQSMLRGVDVSRHGITSNTFQPLARPVPSLFDAAHAAGKKTGFFYNWEQLRDLSAPGSLDVSYFWRDCKSPEGDRHVAEHAIRHIGSMGLDFTFIYLGWPDECAHKHGWMSEPYLRAIENADACVGEVVAAAGDAVILLQSDHGGHGRSHGTDMEEDMRIPWLLAGPGVRHGHAITGEVRIYDTCVTLAHLLGLPPAPEWDGRVVEEALG